MWELEFSAEAEHDFELIFDHLFLSYTDLGDDPDVAVGRAADRIRNIRVSLEQLTVSPQMGTLRPDIRPGLRFVRLERTAVWFLPDKLRKKVMIVAVFFGAQDHIRHMLTRMLSR